ncbi:MAG: glycosyltransferase, partial [Bacilli bacterium]|nr:glycosyltransferase [Bacilli bacterium]
TQPNVKKKKKTPLRMLLREMAWRIGRWNNNYLKKWISDFNPNLIVVVAGDNCFTLDLARRISKKNNLPIVLYSTEEYPFKDYNFVTKRFSLFYNIWHTRLKRAYKRIEKYVSEGFFNTELLADTYSNKYKYDCYHLYQYSDIDFIDNSAIKDNIVISYLGNLGVDRHKPLIEIANTLGEINPTFRLDVYGKPSELVKEEFDKCEFINLKGFIPYEEVINVIHSSSLLIHAESNDKFWNRDLKYAFSTKISDSVCSGTPFLMYACPELAGIKFLIDKKCAFVATTHEMLKETLNDALFNFDLRKEFVKNAKIVKEDYFTNNGKFKEIVEGLL